MIDPKVFKKYGIDADSLKAKFDVKAKQSKEIKSLVDLIRDRIKDGCTRSLKDYRIYAAIDQAYDAPFSQETPTLIRNLLNRNLSAKDMLGEVKKWGLCEGQLFCKTKSGDKEVLELNIPVFFEVLVPVVKAYVTVRLSKIFNDRNLDPLFEYQPRHYTDLNRVRCEIITDIVDVMAVNFGYAANLKQVVLNTLLYSVSLEFPCEPWHEEKQEDMDGKEYTVREGVRYVTPHVTRIGYDLQYPLSTFNTDTGNTFAFYWTILRAGDVLSSKMYWNIDRVTYGFNWLDSSHPWHNYFEQAYPCTLQLPVVAKKDNETDRETTSTTYTSTDYDKAIFVTHMFMKLVPKDWGLGDYKYPVWFRFIVGSDDTILHAEPFPYCPVTVAQYDPDQNRAKNASLGLEIVPWQDLLGNTLTQILLTIKRNLANILFYDTNMDVGSQVEAIQRRSQWQYQSINLIGYDSAKMFRAGTDPRSTFHEVRFAYADTNAMVQSITLYLSIMERMLGISSQEIGSAASHQQSKAEIEIIHANTTNRGAYTASGIDDYIDAKKRQLHSANMAYRDEDVVAEVSQDIPEVESRIKELGYTIGGKTESGIEVKGKKSALRELRLESIASQRDGPERFKDMSVGQAMYTALAAINQNPMLAQILDPVSLAKLYEIAAKFTGADRDFKLKLNKEGVVTGQLQQMLEQIKAEITKVIEQKIATDIAKPAAEAIQEIEGKNAQQDQQLAQLTQIVEGLQQVVDAASAAPPLIPPDAIGNQAIVPDAAGIPS